MTPQCEILQPRWDGPCIVAATGPSLTEEVAAACIASGYPVVAVKQSFALIPTAMVLYALDRYWWDAFAAKRWSVLFSNIPEAEIPDFHGEKWIAWCPSLAPQAADLQQKYGLRVVRGDMKHGFSTNPSIIYYGRNTGFQAINLAIHWLRGPRKRIILVGFDMKEEKKKPYFFGKHPRGPQYQVWGSYISEYERAAQNLPPGVEIVNCSERSALRCFPIVPLAEALAQTASAAPC